MKTLFVDHRDLIVGFAQFLPPGYKADVREPTSRGRSGGGKKAAKKKGDGKKQGASGQGAPTRPKHPHARTPAAP